MKRLLIYILIGCPLIGKAQDSLEFRGQLSAIFSYSPNNRLDLFAGGRYIPELAYSIKMDSFKLLDFEASANLSASTIFHPNDSSINRSDISPYRLWARYSGKQFELRVGLQKIDFGSASFIRPLQWFNRIDPRDPLQLTNGVYAALGRYYFLNNANIWLWTLYGNKEARGFDVLGSNEEIPEFGGRVQYPIPKGELALSYHHRKASSQGLDFLPLDTKIEEDKFGLDTKLDLKVGLWFEASYSRKRENIGLFSHQSMLNLGTDYTFGLGNGLNVIAEHLLASFDSTQFAFEQPIQLTAISMSYPLSFFDNLSMIYYYNWAGNDLTFFLNYEHRFKWFSSYLMLYYNPDTQQGIQQNELINNFSGPGLRIMLVYNH